MQINQKCQEILAEMKRDVKAKTDGYPKMIEAGKLTKEEAVKRINLQKEGIAVLEFHFEMLGYLETIVNGKDYQQGQITNPVPIEAKKEKINLGQFLEGHAWTTLDKKSYHQALIDVKGKYPNDFDFIIKSNSETVTGQ